MGDDGSTWTRRIWRCWIIAYGCSPRFCRSGYCWRHATIFRRLSRLARSRRWPCGIVMMHPPALMPPLTRFVDGNGPVFGGKVFPFAFHHGRMWRNLGLPCADRVRHDAQDARTGGRRTDGRLRLHADGIIRGDHGDDRGGDARTGSVLRDQFAGRGGRGRRSGLRKNLSVGLSGESRRDASIGAVGGRNHALCADGWRAVTGGRHGANFRALARRRR